MTEVETLLRKIVELRQRMHDRNVRLNADKSVSNEQCDISELDLTEAQLELAKYKLEENP